MILEYLRASLGADRDPQDLLGDRMGERPFVVGGLALNAAGLAYWELLVALIVTGIPVPRAA